MDAGWSDNRLRLTSQRLDGIRGDPGRQVYPRVPARVRRRSIYVQGGYRSRARFDFPLEGDFWEFWRVPRQMGTFTDVIGLVDDEFCVRADHSTWRYAARDTDWFRSSVFAGEALSGPVSGVRHLRDGVEAFPTEAEWFEPGRHRIAGIVQSAGSRSHMCMLLNTGRVMCWGDNAAGQCGNFDLGGLCGERGTGPGRCVRRPTEVLGLTTSSQIAARLTRHLCGDGAMGASVLGRHSSPSSAPWPGRRTNARRRVLWSLLRTNTPLPPPAHAGGRDRRRRPDHRRARSSVRGAEEQPGRLLGPQPRGPARRRHHDRPRRPHARPVVLSAVVLRVRHPRPSDACCRRLARTAALLRRRSC